MTNPTTKRQTRKNTELGVVLPLLKRVGWNTERMPEINPQRELIDGKADFDLQIDRESRILIEVKSWGHNLDDKDEDQLARYCRSAKPKLAVLTSGRNWRLYLPPYSKGKSAPLRKFLELDITVTPPSVVEGKFCQFLSRESMVNFRPKIEEARKLHRELEDYHDFKGKLTGAWNELVKDKHTMTKLLMRFCEITSIQASRANVLKFLEEPLPVSLVNEIKKPPPPKKPLLSPCPHLQPATVGTAKSMEPKAGTTSWQNFVH